MNILINTSNLYVGGGVQVALSLINEIKNFKDNYRYIVILSPVIENQLDVCSFPQNVDFYIIEKSPASLKSRMRIIKKLNEIENAVNPDIVFTVFGPAYWKPKAVHLTGFADGWVYNQNSIAYKRLSFIKNVKRRLYNIYKISHLKKESAFFIIETNDAKDKFIKIFDINSSKVFVVGNTHSDVFSDKTLLERNNKNFIELPEREENEFRFVYISHNHPNKNLILIKKILPFLDKVNVKFILTIDNRSYNNIFGQYEKKIINVGPINQKACPSIYQQADALFAPTLLETFSASYPEAMIMRIPILTSEYSFAKDLCKDAAIYFNPLDPRDAVEKIFKIVNSKELQNEKIRKGLERVKEFETSESRAKKYIRICEEIVLNKEG